MSAEKQESERLNEGLMEEHEELQAFMAQETSRHHNAEVLRSFPDDKTTISYNIDFTTPPIIYIHTYICSICMYKTYTTYICM